jgi:hypothetical protein
MRMTRREWLLGLGALVLVAAMPAQAAPNETPKAFLDAIYKNYLGKNANGVALDKPATLRRYFVAPLAEAMIKDNAAAAKRGDVPELDGDPFIDGQDWEITDLAIKVDMAPPEKATGTVTFKNFGKDTTVVLALQRTAAGWRIADIRNGDSSLRALYKLK